MAGALNTFLDKMGNWKFNPPSSNLWVVHIALHNDGTLNANAKHDLLALYDNIKKVNDLYDSTYDSKYGVIVNGANGMGPVRDFIQQSDDGNIGIFLATDMTMSNGKVITKDHISSPNTEFTGWLKYGKVQTGREHNLNIKLKFLKSNWDINELLFDPWIAAIGQQGLIEGDEVDGIYDIKADIVLMEYAASSPGQSTKSWVLRKSIHMTRCFPKSRENYAYDYSYEKAGQFTSALVEFEFDNYTIIYYDTGAAKGETKKAAATPAPAKTKAPEPKIAVNTNVEQGGAGMTNMYANMANMA